MTPLRWNFTLPELQEKLDGLVEGGLFQISARDYERLFGSDDTCAARLRHFAKGHACVVSHADGAILFRKRLEQREDRSPL
ncbi:MAG TPA: hypothetical protein VKR55_02885 [Bradyrhizobium sp.]|uniref:hypothetical protein n=1 Tax=Bradyrhizobium sp. TaxID=376 RepID=UPI002B9D7865|nr:hypothetical protein [Bradyrhizobium sp.]HLZ01078.1 hypothetical protein [Bradyrhizobium sp.]